MNKLNFFLSELVEFNTFDGDVLRGSSVESCTCETEKDGKLGFYPLFSSTSTLIAHSVEGIIKDSLKLGLLLLFFNIRVILLHSSKL